MTITFTETTDPPGLEIHDSLEQRRLRLQTPQNVVPAVIDSEAFGFPVDQVCRFETDTVRIDQPCSMTVHNGNGQSEAALGFGETATLEDRPQFIGLSGPIKLYFRVDTPGAVEMDITSSRLEFDRETTLELGARSLHARPAATITTPPDVESIVKAISALPSALKTTSPERTWPTLRGHPPLIELGDRLDIPEEATHSENHIGLVVPPDRLSAYQVAPLAFFLGATVRTGQTPRLKTPTFTRELGSRRSFEDDVATLLRRFFLLDSLVRMEGVYQYDLYERSMLEADLPFDLSETYDQPLWVRLERFLEVPYDRLEPYVPRWPLTAHVRNEPEAVELLPFVVNELGIVREARETPSASTPSPEPATTRLLRSASGARSPSKTPNDEEFVVPEVTDDAIEHVWFGDGVPKQASKATIEAYQNQLETTERSESIDILLVCNDARMLEEHDLLDQTYGNLDELPFDIDSEFGVSTDRLADLLTDGGYDFLHYIGHATEDGIRCPDGDLDVRTLKSVDLGVFFLNACRSYEQGLALTRCGAFGGVATYRDVINDDAITVGETIARLLNLGFPLRAALEIARENTALGEQYLIVGDGSTDIAQSRGGAPLIVRLETRVGEEYGFSVRTYSTKEYKLGSVSESALSSVPDHHLTLGKMPATAVDVESLQEYLTWADPPILLDETLHWNGGIGQFNFE